MSSFADRWRLFLRHVLIFQLLFLILSYFYLPFSFFITNSIFYTFCLCLIFSPSLFSVRVYFSTLSMVSCLPFEHLFSFSPILQFHRSQLSLSLLPFLPTSLSFLQNTVLSKRENLKEMFFLPITRAENTLTSLVEGPFMYVFCRLCLCGSV